VTASFIVNANQADDTMAKYRNYMFAAILIAAGPLCLAAGASAGVLSTDRYYTWGIDGAALEIPEGSIITEAVLKIKNITNWDNQLSIHLVDNPPVGFVANTDHGDGDFFQDFGGLLTGAIQMVNNDLIITFSQADDENSWVRQIYDWPFDFQLAGGGTVSYTSALLELIDYAGNGTPFGIGFDGEGKTYGFDQITLTITVESFEGQPSSQEFVFSTSGETDLLAWWTMDDNAGTAVVADAGGAGLEGRARRNTNLLSLEGKVDAALAFDGANDYIELNSPAALDGLPAKDFTVTAWIYDTQTLINQGTIFSAYNNGCGFSLRTFGAEGTRRLVFDVPCTLVNADFHSALNSIQLNTWHHVAAVWHADTKTATLYIDGSKALYSIARAGNGIYRSDAANNKEIGRLPLGVQHFKGAIDDVRIYNVALSPEEIAAMYFEPFDSSELIAHWSLDETKGFVISDAATFDLVGTSQRNTATMTTTGRIGQALLMNGTSDHIQLNSPAALDDLPAKDFTVTAWIYDTQTLINQGTIFSAYNNGCGFSLRTFGAEGTRRLVFDVPCTLVNADFHSALNSIQLNTWHHVAAVWHADTKTATLYIDGSKALYSIARAGNGIYRSDAANNKEIGRLPLGVQHFKGAIDDVRIYNVALSPEEIAAMYFEPFDSNGLIGHWSLDETAGLTVGDTAVYASAGRSHRDVAHMTATGVSNRSMLFDGNTDYIELNSPTVLDDLPAGDFTIAAWIYDMQTLLNQGTIFSSYIGGRGFSLRTFGEAGKRCLIFDAPHTGIGADFRSVNGSIKPNTWHHVVAVWYAETRTAELYIDGYEVLYGWRQAGIGAYLSDAANNKEIGRLPLGVQHFKGAIDDLIICKVALSAADVLQLYDAYAVDTRTP